MTYIAVSILKSVPIDEEQKFQPQELDENGNLVNNIANNEVEEKKVTKIQLYKLDQESESRLRNLTSRNEIAVADLK